VYKYTCEAHTALCKPSKHYITNRKNTYIFTIVVNICMFFTRLAPLLLSHITYTHRHACIPISHTHIDMHAYLLRIVGIHISGSGILPLAAFDFLIKLLAVLLNTAHLGLLVVGHE